MEIKELDNSHTEQFGLLAEKFGSVFNSMEWLKIYGNDIILYGIYDNDSKLIGGFHLFKRNQLGFTHFRNPPYTPHIGLFFENKSKNKSNFNSFEKNIMNLICDFFEQLPYKILTIALPPEYKDMLPFFWKKFKVIPNYTYQLNLKNNSIEQLNALMAPERRNDIKKAIKDGIITAHTDDYKIIKEFAVKTFNRKRKAINELLLTKILNEFANKNNSFAFVSYRNEKPIACSFCIHNGKTAYYLLGGYDTQNKHQGAGANAIWEAIKFSKEIGISCFDFEGSVIPEIEKYFRAFGGDIIPYYTINKAKLPIEIGLKFIKRSQF